MSTFLLLVHAAAAIVLIGAATHNGVLAYQSLRGRKVRRRLQRLYPFLMFCAYVPTVGLGLVIYPAFRLEVRAELFDATLPLATGFFEVKEHWAALGLFVLLAYLPLVRRVELSDSSAQAVATHVLGLVLTVIIWVALWTGLALSAIAPVGAA